MFTVFAMPCNSISLLCHISIKRNLFCETNIFNTQGYAHLSDALSRASDISRGRGPAKFRFFREIRHKYFQIHVGKTYFILILAIRPVLFNLNVQIYLET